MKNPISPRVFAIKPNRTEPGEVAELSSAAGGAGERPLGYRTQHTAAGV